MLVQVQDITERRGLEDQLRHLADHDALTGLLNRRGMDRRLAQHVARGRRYGAEGALLVLDLDGFKAVNDSLGHARATSSSSPAPTRCATACARPTSSGAWAATSSRSCSPPRARRRRSRSPRRSSAVIREVGGVTASVGVTPFGDEPTPTSALDRADMAMYAAKQAGRDRYEYTPGPLPATA